MVEVQDLTNTPTIMPEFRGHTFIFTATKDAPALIQEIFSDNYKVFSSQVAINPGDTIIDLGANEGIFSIMLAKLFPDACILAFEPVPRTYATLQQNIRFNGCKNIQAFCAGIGKPGHNTATLNVSKDHSGGSTALCTHNPDHHDQTEISLLSLDDIFSLHHIERCRLLKIDIEGMEYEALYNCTILPQCDYVTGEFHTNRRLDFECRRMDALATWVGNQTQLLHVELCKMAE